MTRGRRGSLALQRRALTSPPSCRLIPALPRSPATGHLPGHHQAAGQLTARATPLRGLRGPGQRWECSHAVIKDHPPRRYRRLEQPPCSGGPAHRRSRSGWHAESAGLSRAPIPYPSSWPLAWTTSATVWLPVRPRPAKVPAAFYRVERSAYDLAAAPGRWPGFLPAAPVGIAGVRGGTAAGGSDRQAARVVGAVRDGQS